jgi:hypothetical protein
MLLRGFEALDRAVAPILATTSTIPSARPDARAHAISTIAWKRAWPARPSSAARLHADIHDASRRSRKASCQSAMCRVIAASRTRIAGTSNACVARAIKRGVVAPLRRGEPGIRHVAESEAPVGVLRPRIQELARLLERRHRRSARDGFVDDSRAEAGRDARETQRTAPLQHGLLDLPLRARLGRDAEPRLAFTLNST